MPVLWIGKDMKKSIANIVKTIKISELKPAKYNPRQISEEALAGLTTSMKEFGCVQPIIWNEQTGNVVGGHQRLKVLEAEGASDTEVVVVDLSLEKEKALNVALNSKYISGDWTAGLGVILNEIKEDTPSLFENLNFDALFDDVPEIPEPVINGNTDPDAVPGAPEETAIKTGDLVRLGNHKILCGDSTKKDDVDMLMAGRQIDCAIVDPPYGVSYTTKNKFLNEIDNGSRNQKDIELDHGTTKETAAFWALLFNLISYYLNDYSSYYIFGSSTQIYELIEEMGTAKIPMRHILIWAKNNHVLGRCDYNYQHELILFGWKNRHRFYGEGTHKTSVWNVDKPQKNDLHPTMKPVELIENAILNSTKKEMIVADFCLGSGTVLIACESTNRICYGIEIDPGYVQVSAQRWIDFTGRPEDVTFYRDGKEYSWEELAGD